jgi:hypothetical protein
LGDQFEAAPKVSAEKNNTTADTVINAANPYFATEPRSLLKIRPLAMAATPPTKPPRAPPLSSSRFFGEYLTIN